MIAPMTCKLRHSSITPKSPHYLLRQWPPARDWPVSFDAHGRIVSRVADGEWDLSAYVAPGQYCSFRFSRVTDEQEKVDLDPRNRWIFQQVLAYLMWGDRRSIAVNTLRAYAHALAPIFTRCSEHGFPATNLWKHAQLQVELATDLSPSIGTRSLALLHELWSVRDFLGFQILDAESLKRFEGCLKGGVTQQTPYIPPRIWVHQNQRLQDFVADFLLHGEALQRLYHHCLRSYLRNFGSPEMAFPASDSHDVGARSYTKSPFSKTARNNSGCTYEGPFMEVAGRFGVAHLLERWTTGDRSESESDETIDWGINRLQTYLSMVQFVGHKAILNATGMRRREPCYLRTSSYHLERDEHLGDIHTLRGLSPKECGEQEVYWISGPEIVDVHKMLATTSQLRLLSDSSNPHKKVSPLDKNDPLLLTSPSEPWACRTNIGIKGISNSAIQYDIWSFRYPKLFDSSELIITAEDLRIARLVTPTLDPDIYREGLIWHFYCHQYRRTNAVNMRASGVVSIPSLQIQYKHRRRAVSLYYGQGFTHLALDEKLGAEYIRTAYEMLRLQISQLSDPRYVSPYGDDHKANLLKKLQLPEFDPVNPSGIARLRRRTTAGELGARPTLMGLCLNPKPCPKGGITNVAPCVKCADALLDTEKSADIMSLIADVDDQLSCSTVEEVDRESLEQQRSAAEAYLSIIERQRKRRD